MSYAGKSRLWEFLDQGLFRDLGLPALVASLVLFVSAMGLLSTNISEMRTGYARVRETNEALLQIAMVNADILRIEMSVRGYALSGDASYLAWQGMAEQALQNRLATLEKTVADDPGQRREIETLKSLVAAHWAHFNAMAKLVPVDRNRMVAQMVDYSKKVKRRPIEDLLVTIRTTEARRLAEEENDAERRVVVGYRYAAGIAMIALLLGGLGFALILHDRRAGRTRG
jgi:CHASE3 domain sensor protein